MYHLIVAQVTQHIVTAAAQWIGFRFLHYSMGLPCTRLKVLHTLIPNYDGDCQLPNIIASQLVSSSRAIGYSGRGVLLHQMDDSIYSMRIAIFDICIYAYMTRWHFQVPAVLRWEAPYDPIACAQTPFVEITRSTARSVLYCVRIAMFYVSYHTYPLSYAYMIYAKHFLLYFICARTYAHDTKM